MALTICRDCKKEVSTEAATCPHCGTSKPWKRAGTVSGWVKVVGVIFVLALIGRAMGHGPSSTGGATTIVSSAAAASDAPAAVDALSQLKFTYTWNKQADDLVMSIDFTIRNLSDHAFKDFEITCIGFAPSGTEIDRNVRTVYQTVKAHGKRSMSDFNMGFLHTQVSGENCKVTNIVPVA